MDEPPPSPSEPGADLIDRWLAHREGRTTPPSPRTPGDDAPLLEPVLVDLAPEREPEPEPEEAWLQAERDAEAARAEEARAGAVGSGHQVLAAFATASASTVAAAPERPAPPAARTVRPAPPLEEDAPERLSWSTGSRLSRLSRRRKVARPTPEPGGTAQAVPAPLDAAHQVLAAFAAGEPTPGQLRSPTPEAPSAAEAPPRVTLVADEPPLVVATPGPPADPAPEAASRTPTTRTREPATVSGDVTFTPRRGARRAVGLLLLAALAATAYAGYLAYEAQTVESVVVAAGLGLVTLLVWGIRAGSSVSHLSVTRGQLEIHNSSGRFVFDLASPYLPVEVVGSPGSRTWKVLFARRSLPPFTVDSSMVDPQEFMTVLRHYRPEDDAS